MKEKQMVEMIRKAEAYPRLVEMVKYSLEIHKITQENLPVSLINIISQTEALLTELNEME